MSILGNSADRKFPFDRATARSEIAKIVQPRDYVLSDVLANRHFYLVDHKLADIIIISGEDYPANQRNHSHFEVADLGPRSVEIGMSNIQVNRETEGINLRTVRGFGKQNVNIVVDSVNITIPSGSENEKTGKIDEKIPAGTFVFRPH